MKPVCHPFTGAHLLELLQAACPRAHCLQQEKPAQREAHALQNENSPYSLQLDKACLQPRRPAQPKKIFLIKKKSRDGQIGL